MVFLNEQGDGVLVDSQGYDYARYMCLAPKIQEYIDKRLEEELEQKATLEIKLYVPLKVTQYEAESEDEVVEIDGSEYYQKIREKVQLANLADGKRGLASYLHKETFAEKVFSIKPDIEYRNGTLIGIARIKMTEPLNDLEMQELKAYCEGQFSDGWGESFEQRDIDTMNGEIYVHFWQHSDEYKVMTEAEFENREQDHSQGMSGVNM